MYVQPMCLYIHFFLHNITNLQSQSKSHFVILIKIYQIIFSISFFSMCCEIKANDDDQAEQLFFSL